MESLLEQFSERCPVAVMARLGLQRAVGAEWVEAVFAEHRGMQYTRELAFSTVVDLMALVAVGLQPSLHAAARKHPSLGVSITSLYNKVNATDPGLIRALVRGSATRLEPVRDALPGSRAAALPGYRVRVVDGNHLPASEKRLGPLRGHRGAALPGQSLVVSDLETLLVTDIVPCEDGHASEQGLLSVLLADAAPGDLWIGDRNFCTRAAILAARARGAHVLFREPTGHPRPTEEGAWVARGRVETGEVLEQPVSIPSEGRAVGLRRIEVRLDAPTEDGDTTLRLLTTLPAAVEAPELARLYRQRWSIERLFGQLESALQSEVRTLGHPRAALLAFGLAVVAYNVLNVMEAALAAAHRDEEEVPISTYQLVGDVRLHFGTLAAMIDGATWEGLDAESPARLARRLLRIAGRVDLERLRKFPKRAGPKKRVGYAPRPEVEKHVATARVLAAQRSAKRP